MNGYNNNSDTLKRAYQLKNIEKATGMGVVGSEQAPSLIASIPVAINTVSDLFNAVKQRDANFNPKPVSPIHNIDSMTLATRGVNIKLPAAGTFIELFLKSEANCFPVRLKLK